MTPMDWMDQIYEHFTVPVAPYVAPAAVILALALGVVLLKLARAMKVET